MFISDDQCVRDDWLIPPFPLPPSLLSPLKLVGHFHQGVLIAISSPLLQ